MKLLIGIISVLLSGQAIASFDSCKSLFLNNTPPQYTGSAKTIELCNDEFAILYAPQVKTPIYSYMYVNTIGNIKRQGSFKVDSRLSATETAVNKDYTNSGYDRGHLTASADANTVQSQDQTFLFSNVAPQAPKFNQQQWRLLEANVRNKYTYIVTGIIYQGQRVKVIGNNVGIPTHFYKIVSDKNKCSVVYIAENKNDAIISQIKLTELEELTKIKYNLPYRGC